MKTLLLTFLSLFSIISFSNAQLRVDSKGNLRIGDEPVYPGTIDSTVIIPLRVFGPELNHRAGGRITFGDFSDFKYGGGNVVIGEYGNTDTDQMWLHGKNGFYLTRYNNTPGDVVAYYNPKIDNRFNFNCEVFATGTVYSSEVAVASDERFKENVKELGGSLSRLKQLNGVSYNLKQSVFVNRDQSLKLRSTSQEILSSENLSEKEKESLALIEQWRAEEKKNVRNVKQLGFIAQDLKKVFPELVNEGKDGYMYVNYIGLIPVIVEALKEQNSVIEAQSAKIKELEASLAGDLISIDIPMLRNSTSGLSQAVSDKISHAYLYQNSPNPFSTETEIRFFLPENVTQAYICIFDMQGTMLKKTDNLVGRNNLLVQGSEFNPGMYLYSLIAEGQEVDTKRMILTK